MLRIALRNVLAHKLRTALTGIAIVLGVGFVAGTYMFSDSIDSTLDNLFADVYQGVDISVRPAEGDLGAVTDSFSSSVLDDVAEVEGILVAEPSVNGTAVLVDKQGERIGGQGPPSLGFSWAFDEEINPLQLLEGNGRAPLAPGEIAIDVNTANQNDFAIGDTVGVLADGPRQDFELVGIVTFGQADSLAGATLAVFELSQAQELFGLEDQFNLIDIRVEPGQEIADVQTQVENAIPDSLEVVTGESQANEQLEDITAGFGFFTTALLVFAYVSVFAAIFTIYNTFRIVIVQRTKELGLLRAIGTSRAQVLRIVMYEAVFVGVISSALGLLFGIGISYGLRGLLNAIGFGLPGGPLEVAPRTVTVALAVGIGATLVASLFPALRASRISPMRALRDSAATTKPRTLLARGLLGFLLIAIGGAAILYGLRGSDVSQPLIWVGAGAFGQFLGVATIAPLVAIPVARFFAVIFGRLRGVQGRIAGRNAARTPRRTASTAASLMIGVSLIAFVSILATSFKSVVDEVVGETFAADLTIFDSSIGDAGPGSNSFTPQVAEDLRGVEGIDEVSVVRYAFEGFEVEGDTSAFVLAGVDPSTFDSSFAKLKPSDGAFEALDGQSVVVHQGQLDSRNLAIGDSINIAYASGTTMYEIVGSFEEAFDSDYLLANSEYLRHFDDDITLVGATITDDAEIDVVKEAATTALAGYPQVTINTQADLIQQAQEQIDQILALLWALLGMAVVIAVFGITNTLLLSISERTREIGLLRAVGATRPQVRTMVRYESIIIALFGLLLGAVMGVFFAWVIIDTLRNTEIDRLSMTVSLAQIAAYVVFAVVAGILAAIWPARKAARMDILKAISFE